MNVLMVDKFVQTEVDMVVRVGYVPVVLTMEGSMLFE